MESESPLLDEYILAQSGKSEPRVSFCSYSQCRRNQVHIYVYFLSLVMVSTLAA